MKNNLESKTDEAFIIGNSPELKQYAQENNLSIYKTPEEYENKTRKKEKLYEHTRKSILGAVYRVGTSFTADAIYLSLAAAGAYYASENLDSLESMVKGFSDFVHGLDPGKLMRVAGFVVGINFLDYKFDVTNKLNKNVKKFEKYVSNKLVKVYEKIKNYFKDS